jgi:hypothetical protein
MLPKSTSSTTSSAAGPVEMFASSGGAVSALALVAATATHSDGFDNGIRPVTRSSSPR